MYQFYVAKAYNQLIERAGTSGGGVTQLTAVTLPAGHGCSVPVGVQFLAGRDGATIQNPATGTVIEIIIKKALTDTQRLARFYTTSAVTSDFFTGDLRMDSDQLTAALAASAEKAKGTFLSAWIEVVYTLSGGHPVSTIPLPVNIYLTGYNSSDTNPTYS